jgi:putative ABC transport system permease protein
MVMRQGIELAVAGVAVGLLGAIALTRVMAAMLFEVSATDVLTFSIAPVALLLTAALASGIPALRASRVDPVVALRDE